MVEKFWKEIFEHIFNNIIIIIILLKIIIDKIMIEF